MERHVLADGVASADHEPRRLALVLLILRDLAHGCEGVDHGLTTDLGVAGDVGMGSQHDAFGQANVGTHHRVGANLHAGVDLRAGVDYGARVNWTHVFSSQSRKTARNLLSATMSPRTMAVPSKR